MTFRVGKVARRRRYDVAGYLVTRQTNTGPTTLGVGLAQVWVNVKGPVETVSIFNGSCLGYRYTAHPAVFVVSPWVSFVFGFTACCAAALCTAGLVFRVHILHVHAWYVFLDLRAWYVTHSWA